ncbi:MAG: nicotinate-nucleotide--dimethylbenzimidazole phosphoribosyltransferase [Eisenbergiella massiliensis]
METETERYLNSCKERIRGIDERSWKAARRHWNGIAKPLYGLGLLEDALVRIAGIPGNGKCVPGKEGGGCHVCG